MTKEKCKIVMFWHCRKCMETIPDGQSPEFWGRLSVGWTDDGLQVWCARHKQNVVDFAFDEGGRMIKREGLPPRPH